MASGIGTSDYEVVTLEAQGVASVTFSNDGSLIYAALRNGKIDVFDTNSHQLLKTWAVGTELGGASLSEDGSYLLVTEERYDYTTQDSVIHRVDTKSGATIDYATKGYVHDVEVVDKNTAIISGQQMQKLDLVTGTFSALGAATYYSSGGSVLVEDSHLTLIAEPGISNGPLFIYDDRVGRVTASGDDYQTIELTGNGYSTGFNFGHQAISENAGQVAQFIGRSILIYDLAVKIEKIVPVGGLVDGLAYDQTGQFLFVRLIETGKLVKYDTTNWQVVAEFDVGVSPWHNHSGTGDQIHLSADGNHILVADTYKDVFGGTDGGKLQIIDLSPLPSPACPTVDRPGTQDGSGATNDVLVGAAYHNSFFFDTKSASGKDKIMSFGKDDVIVTGAALLDKNHDGIVPFGSDHRFNLGIGSTFSISGPTKALRFLGECCAGDFVYADATVRPAGAFEGLLNHADTLKGDAGNKIAETFFVDTALDLNVGADIIRSFGSSDILVTTTQIADNNHDGIIKTGRDHVFNLPGGVGGPLDDSLSSDAGSLAIGGVNGKAITALEYDGVVAHGGVNYYVYSMVGSAASVGDLHF